MLLVSEPSLGEDEKAALIEVIDCNWITMGTRVQAFERAFAAEHGTPDAVAVNSCTAGLHLAVASLGIGSGDEVLVPSLSFVATANAVLYTGAKPVFVDIEALTSPLMSLSDAAEKCTRRTKAVMVMHYGGELADAPAWRRFADSRGLRLIEDSAHAVGHVRGPVFGDLAAFSFYGNKNMTTGEGGMVTSHDDRLLGQARQARGHGLTSSTLERLIARAVTYDVTMLGYNYRMTELNAALGLVQLAKLGSWNERRRDLARVYEEELREYCPTVVLPFSGNRLSCHHILPILLPDRDMRDMVIQQLKHVGVQTTFHYPPIHQLSFYRELFPGLSLPNTEEFAERQLTLPLHPKMEETQVLHVVHSLATILGR